MRKLFFTAILFMIAMLLALNCIAQTDYHTFTLTIDGKETAVNLPKEVPDMKDAKHIGEQCFDAHLCVDHYAINKEETLSISFWHYKGEIVGFVLHKFIQDIVEHTPWLYADGMPTLVSGGEFNAKLTDLYHGG